MKYSHFSVIIKVNKKSEFIFSRKKVESVIGTENNKALEEVQKEKLEIQELHIKIKNLDNDPELKESLAKALISKAATDHNIVEFYDYYKSEVTKYKGLCREFLEKSRTMDDDEKDLFWYLIASLIRLIHTMYNEDFDEGFDLYLSVENSSNVRFNDYGRFASSWVYENISEIFSKDELDFITPYFSCGSGDGIRDLISKIGKEIVTEDPILDEISFWGFLNELFTDVNIYSQRNESGELSFTAERRLFRLNFENLAPPRFSDIIDPQSLSEDKLNNHIVKSQKFRLLFGKYFRFIISNIRYPDCGGDEETRAKLKERFLSDPNLKEFLDDQLEVYAETLLDTNWNKLYPWSG